MSRISEFGCSVEGGGLLLRFWFHLELEDRSSNLDFVLIPQEGPSDNLLVQKRSVGAAHVLKDNDTIVAIDPAVAPGHFGIFDQDIGLTAADGHSRFLDGEAPALLVAIEDRQDKRITRRERRAFPFDGLFDPGFFVVF